MDAICNDITVDCVSLLHFKSRYGWIKFGNFFHRQGRLKSSPEHAEPVNAYRPAVFRSSLLASSSTERVPVVGLSPPDLLRRDLALASDIGYAEQEAA